MSWNIKLTISQAVDSPTRPSQESIPGFIAGLIVLSCFGCASNSQSSTAGFDAKTDNDDAQSATDACPPKGKSYANIVAVLTSGERNARKFTVSVESSDKDCTRYANWWEILSSDGTLIYRRILGHSHTDANGTSDPDAPGNTFTRSSIGTVDVGNDDVLFIRAHMNDVGYVGQLMTGSINSGFQVATNVAKEFAENVESLPPQPEGCAF